MHDLRSILCSKLHKHNNIVVIAYPYKLADFLRKHILNTNNDINDDINNNF